MEVQFERDPSILMIFQILFDWANFYKSSLEILIKEIVPQIFY